MKKIFLCVLAMASIFASCNKNDGINPTKESVKKGTKFMATVGVHQGKIVVEGDEMAGGAAYAASENDLLGIEVSKTTDATTSPVTTELVASGLFKGNQTGLKVELEHGVDYIFEATLIRNGNTLSKGTGDAFVVPFTDQADAERSLSDLTKWTVKQVSDLKSFKSLSAVNLDPDNQISEKDRFYAKFTHTADYENPELTMALRRVSIAIRPFIYNVGVNCYVTGEIATTNNGIVNFPVQDENVDGIETITNDLCVTSKTFDILGTFDTSDDITADCYSEDRYIVLNNVGNAYDYRIDDKIDFKQADVQLRFYIKAKDGDADQTNDVLLRTLNAKIRPFPNKIYNVSVDASTDVENAINITTDDTWVEGIYVVAAE